MYFSKKKMTKQTYQQTKTLQEKPRDIDCNMEQITYSKHNIIQC